jgi:hypothetical protein
MSVRHQPTPRLELTEDETIARSAAMRRVMRRLLDPDSASPTLAAPPPQPQTKIEREEHEAATQT